MTFSIWQQKYHVYRISVVHVELAPVSDISASASHSSLIRLPGNGSLVTTLLNGSCIWIHSLHEAHKEVEKSVNVSSFVITFPMLGVTTMMKKITLAVLSGTGILYQLRSWRLWTSMLEPSWKSSKMDSSPFQDSQAVINN